MIFCRYASLPEGTGSKCDTWNWLCALILWMPNSTGLLPHLYLLDLNIEVQQMGMSHNEKNEWFMIGLIQMTNLMGPLQKRRLTPTKSPSAPLSDCDFSPTMADDDDLFDDVDPDPVFVSSLSRARAVNGAMGYPYSRREQLGHNSSILRVAFHGESIGYNHVISRLRSWIPGGTSTATKSDRWL